MRIDVLILVPHFQVFKIETDFDSLNTWDPIRRMGVFSDGKSFKVVCIDSAHWDEHIKGIRFKEYKLLGGLATTIRPRDLQLVQARMQLG